MVESIGTSLAATAPVLPTLSSQTLQQILTSAPLPVPQPVTDQVNISLPAGQQPGQPREEYADPEVLGTTAFSLYKGSDGKYVTRIVDEKTGKVTYIPKETPVLGGGSDNAPSPVLNITA